MEVLTTGKRGGVGASVAKYRLWQATLINHDAGTFVKITLALQGPQRSLKPAPLGTDLLRKRVKESALARSTRVDIPPQGVANCLPWVIAPVVHLPVLKLIVLDLHVQLSPITAERDGSL